MVWERGLSQSLLERALALLSACCPESSAEAIAAWPIGTRDARLMQLREWMFGPLLTNTTQCPQCSERVEWESRISDFIQPNADAGSATAAFDLSTGGCEVRFRLPTSRDMAEVLQEPGEAAMHGLLTRCTISARQGNSPCEASDLPEAVLTDMAKRMEELDPLADIRIALTCPQCSHGWNAQFDIVGYLWTEIHQWAQQTLNAVHRLATAYGWSERDILELSPARRQLYLGLIHS